MRRTAAVLSITALVIAVAWMICEPHFEPLIVIVAGIAALVTSTSREPFSLSGKLEFYDRRLAIYRAIHRFISQVTANAHPTLDQLGEFIDATQEARFLFDRETADFVSELHHKAVRLRYINRKLGHGDTSDEQRHTLAEEDGQILLWFADRLEELKERFSRYLEVDAQ